MSSILFLLLLFFTDWWTFVVFQPSPTPTTVARHRFFSNRKPRLYPVYRQLLCLKPRRIPLLSPEVAFAVTIVQIVGGLSNSRRVKGWFISIEAKYKYSFGVLSMLQNVRFTRCLATRPSLFGKGVIMKTPRVRHSAGHSEFPDPRCPFPEGWTETETGPPLF